MVEWTRNQERNWILLKWSLHAENGKQEELGWVREKKEINTRTGGIILVDFKESTRIKF